MIADSKVRHVHRRRVLLVVSCISVVAIALRWARLSWGLPDEPGYLGFPDEALMWGPFVKGFVPLSWASFDPRNLVYPTLYGYLIGLVTTALHALGWIADQPSLNNPFRVRPESILIARGVAAATSTATVAIVGFAAARMYSPSTGLVAAALMAVVPFEVMYAHLASPDVPLTLFMTLAIVLAYLVVASPKPWSATIAGVACGASVATKYTGLAVTIATAWAVLERAVGERSIRRALTGAGLALLGFFVAVAIFCPPCWLQSDRMLAAMQNHLRVSSDLYPNLHNGIVSPTLGWYGRPYAYQLVASLPYTLGWPLYALALFGLAVALRRRELADRIVLAGIVPYFLVMSASMVAYPRYLLPVLPGLVILAARGVEVLRDRRIRGVVLGFVWVYSLTLGLTQIVRFSFDQQREVARWIAEEARRSGPAAKPVVVGVPEMMLDYFRLAAFFRAEHLELMNLADGEWFKEPAQFFVLPHWYEVAIEREMPNSQVARDLQLLRSGAAGYRAAKTWRSSYLQSDLYTWLDPAFSADVWQGEIGFTVYVRRDAPTVGGVH